MTTELSITKHVFWNRQAYCQTSTHLGPVTQLLSWLIMTIITQKTQKKQKAYWKTHSFIIRDTAQGNNPNISMNWSPLCDPDIEPAHCFKRKLDVELSSLIIFFHFINSINFLFILFTLLTTHCPPHYVDLPKSSIPNIGRLFTSVLAIWLKTGLCVNFKV